MNDGRYQCWFRKITQDTAPYADLGVIRDTQTGKDLFHIVYCDEEVAAAHMREAVLRIPTSSAAEPVVYVTRQFALKLGRGINAAWFAMFHEAGHVLLYNRSEKRTSNSLERKAAVLSGKASKEELEADAFAAENFGLEASIEALKSLKRARSRYDKARQQESSFHALMAQKEYDFRIDALERKLATAFPR